ncbi:MAG: aldehyde dehydrogenase [Rikenellaceae bacterium]
MQQRVENSVKELKAFFATGATKQIDFRLRQLSKLKTAILANQAEIEEALWSDLHKSPEESYLTEIGIVLLEIDNQIKHLRGWSKPKRVGSPIFLLPSSSKIIYEPLGVALIMAPWNYPFQLTLNPLVGAIAAGCCAMVKPAPASSATSKVIETIIRDCFDSRYIDIVQGRREVNTILLKQRYDIIFFTGSPSLGKIVSHAAADNLTPTILELGGKSPCIVDHDATISAAAKRIAWGKFINAGQTCICPDYLFVHNSIKEQLLTAIKDATIEMYGKEPKKSRFYPRIITDSAFEGLCRYIDAAEIYYGGEYDAKERYIAPTIIKNVSPEDDIMQEEIFGPLLPVMTFDNIEEVYSYVNSHEKPLALYYFGKSGDEVLHNTTSGGSCINDTIMHITNHKLPFGGVGNSGMGRYHGHESFLAFSNQRAVVTTPTWIDLPFKYAPYSFFKLVKRLM